MLRGSAPEAWVLRQALRVAPRLGRAHRGLMLFHADRREWEQAVVHARAAAAADPADARATLLLARGLRRLGRHPEVVEVLQDFVRRPSAPSEAWELLGRSLRVLGRLAEARDCLERALPGARRRVAVLHELALACIESGDVAAFLACSREERRLLAESCPKHADLERWIDVEIALGDEGRPTEALLAALHTLPRHPERDRAVLKQLASLGPLPNETLALAESLALGYAELTWIARVSRLLGAGERARAAAELCGLEPTQRWCRAWSALMQVADPGHFAAPAPAARPPQPNAGDLAAVACFFDATGASVRVRNFERFRRRIQQAGVPLLVVELAFGDRPFRLQGLDDVVQLRGGDLMWQKERLLNVGIERLLERRWQKIAWLDADLIFETPDWAQRVSRALDEWPLCQAFGQAHVSWLGNDPGVYLPSSAWIQQQRQLRPLLGFAGLAWAARAELLREVRLYDGAVLGSGDMMTYAASWLEPQPEGIDFMYRASTSQMGPAMRAHYERWAQAWGTRVRGRVGVADNCVQTLYHGPVAARRYAQRSSVLLRHDFSPDHDLALTPDGCWRWASDKPDLHREVAAYFASRGEQDAVAPPEPR